MYATASDGTLLEGLLGREAAKASRRSLTGLMEMEEAGLADLGLSPPARRRLLACAELARRYQPRSPEPRAITCAGEAVAQLQHLRGLDREVLAVLLLDTRLRPRAVEVIATGGLARVAVMPGDVFKPAVVAGAGAVIIAHNHPSGVATPSREDREFTKAMSAAGAVLKIDVVDHLILAARAFYSFREEGTL